MEFGKIYFARIAQWDDQHTLQAEDLTIFGVNFTHFDGEAATVDLECFYPESGLLSGPRFGVLSIEIDGVETVLARGQIVGHPVALPGEVVTVEMLCRRPDHTQQIDELYAVYDAQIPSELADDTMKRRSEPFVSAKPYIDPVTLSADWSSIAGVTSFDRTLVGENGTGEISDILEMGVLITDAPATEVEIVAEAYFVEERMREIDLFEMPVDGTSLTTLTPEALSQALQSPIIDGGGFEFLEASLQTTKMRDLNIVTSKRQVDPFTCVVTPATVEQIPVHRIDNGTLNVLAFAEQPRREVLKFRMKPMIQDIGGGEVVTEHVTIANIGNRIRKFVPYSFKDAQGNLTQKAKKLAARRKIWFDESGTFRPENQDILHTLAFRAAKILNERSHCVELTLNVRLQAAIGLSLKDRLRVVDSRLNGGQAMGKITSISYSINSSEEATVTISCPISAPAEARTADYRFSYWFDHDGDEDQPPAAQAVDALRNGSVNAHNFFVEDFRLENLEADQMQNLANHTEENVNATALPDPLSEVPPTGFTVDLAEANPIDLEELGDHEVRLMPAELRLPQGIVLS